MWKKWCVASLLLSASLSAQVHVLLFSGSTRQDSANQKLIALAAKDAEETGANVRVIYLRDYPMPFYNADLEAKEGVPEKAKNLAKLFAESQIIVISSPEYNASVSPLLKNTIDWISRTNGSGPSAFKGKEFVLISASPGSGGGNRGLKHLTEIIKEVGGNVWNKQLTLPNAYSAFDERGNLNNPAARKELKSLIQQAIDSKSQMNQNR